MNESWVIIKEYMCDGDLNKRFSQYYQKFQTKERAEARMQWLQEGNELDFFDPKPHGDSRDGINTHPLSENCDPNVHYLDCRDVSLFVISSNDFIF